MKREFSFSLVKERFYQTLKLYIYIFVPMWILFLLNESVFFGKWNSFGVVPRTLNISSLIGVLGSWTMHSNVNHILNNTIVMAQVLFVFGVFERKAFRIIGLMILGSGIATWLLGSENSIHIGASGLAFAMFGYMLGTALFARRWEYLIICVFLGFGFWISMLQGLIPKQGISFAGHFGGLIAGLFLGANSNRKTKYISGN